MTSPDPLPTDPAFARMPKPLQWGALFLLSAVLVILAELAALPAAFLLGPMAAAIVAGANGAAVRVPGRVFALTQGVVGCLVAASVEPEIALSLLADWPVFLAVVLLTLAASGVLGWLISRWKVLPGSTAVWGSAPGGATAMVLMAEAFGADARLVAFMQYLRVVMVSAAASLAARLWVDTSGVEATEIVWFPPIEPLPLLTTFAVVLLGGPLGRLIRLPSHHFLGSLILAATLHLGFGLDLQLPPWLLALSYTGIGWSLGLNFTRAILVHAARALPQVFGSIVILMAFCGGLAWFLAAGMGVDPLTAYLATSPGGLDSIAIIAAASDNVDLSFVMALQTMRLIVVLAFGPPLARLITRWVSD